MTFEEYRQKQDAISKIDTPEKLAICEQQYQAHQRALESYSHFEPLEEKLDDGLVSTYNQNLYSILNFNEIKPHQILFLIQPSFEPESLLTIEKSDDIYSLVYNVLYENYWYQYYGNHSVRKAKMRTTSGYLSNAIGDRLFFLIDRCLNEAKVPQSGFMVLDGVKYKISKVVGDCRKNVFKHSPDENSKTGRIITLLETVARLTGEKLDHDFEIKIQNLLDLL